MCGLDRIFRVRIRIVMVRIVESVHVFSRLADIVAHGVPFGLLVLHLTILISVRDGLSPSTHWQKE